MPPRSRTDAGPLGLTTVRMDFRYPILTDGAIRCRGSAAIEALRAVKSISDRVIVINQGGNGTRSVPATGWLLAEWGRD